MENNFTEEVKQKSDAELKNIVINPQMYRGAVTSAARDELANRGIELSEDERMMIQINWNKRKQAAIDSREDNSRESFSFDMKKNIVTDLNAPQLYSRLVINVFSVAFSVLFGGILLAMNLKTVDNKKAISPVMFFSVSYTAMMIYIMNLIPGSKTGISLSLNFIGALVLNNFFWGKYIGKDFQYRTKPFWIPLIIGILITAFFFWVMFVGSEV